MPLRVRFFWGEGFFPKQTSERVEAIDTALYAENNSATAVFGVEISENGIVVRGN